MPYVLRSLLGKSATTGLLVLIFMAITSTVSSSMIAVSSIISLDFFRGYINPRASDRRMMQVSHWAVVGYGIFMSGFAIMLEYAGATNNWSTYFRPIIACPGILPLILTLLWSRQTTAAAIASPILGLISGVATWLSLSWLWSGAINITTTQVQLPGLYGAIVSFFSPALYSVAISLFYRPVRFDWREFLRIDLIEDESRQQSSSTKSPSSSHLSPSNEALDEKSIKNPAACISEKEGVSYASSSDGNTTPRQTSNAHLPVSDLIHPFPAPTLHHIRTWFRYASIYFVINVLVTILLWPIPLYRDYIFSEGFFKGWVAVAILWHFFAMAAVVVYPVWDGRREIGRAWNGMVGDVLRRGR